MKTAVSMFSFAQDADLREKFALIRRAGYDGVEPVMSEAGYLTHLSSEAEIRKIGKMQDYHRCVTNQRKRKANEEISFIVESAKTKEKEIPIRYEDDNTNSQIQGVHGKVL